MSNANVDVNSGAVGSGVVGKGALKWLQKAGDLLDQLDKTAAETIASGGNEDEDVLAILGEEEEEEAEAGWEEDGQQAGGSGLGGGDDHKDASDQPAAARNSKEPAGSIAKDELGQVQARLRKRESQITKLVSAHKDMSQKVADNEASLKKTTAAMEERVKSAELQLRRKEEELVEIKGMLSSANGEMATSREAARTTQEAMLQDVNEARAQLEACEQSLSHTEHQLATERERAEVMKRNQEELKAEVDLLRAREEDMSGASVDSSMLLAAAQRGKEESERAARLAADQLKEALEMLEISKASVSSKDTALSDSQRRTSVLEKEISKLREDVVKWRSDAAASQLALSQQAAAAPAVMKQQQQSYVPPAQTDSEMQQQLSKMVERLEHKQAALESALGEKSAIEARLENEMARTRELQLQLGAWHGPQVTDMESLLPMQSKRVHKREWTADVQHIIASRDPLAAWKLFDEVCQRASVAIAHDATVRLLVVGYLVLLQFSAFTVLVHALLGKHQH